MKKTALFALLIAFLALLSAPIAAQDMSESEFKQLLIDKSPWKMYWSTPNAMRFSDGTIEIVFSGSPDNLKGAVQNFAYINSPPAQYTSNGDGPLSGLKVEKVEKKKAVSYEISYRMANGADAELSYKDGVLTGRSTKDYRVWAEIRQQEVQPSALPKQ